MNIKNCETYCYNLSFKQFWMLKTVIGNKVITIQEYEEVNDDEVEYIFE